LVGVGLVLAVGVGPVAAVEPVEPVEPVAAVEPAEAVEPVAESVEAGSELAEAGAVGGLSVPAGERLVPAILSGTEAFTVSPGGPWKGGQEVSINFKGWTANQLVVALTCPKGVWPAANPPGGGCAPYTNPAGGSSIGTIKADGTLSLKVTIVEGKLAGTDYTCSTATPCTLGAYSTDEDANAEKGPSQMPPQVTIKYVGASSGSSGGSATGGASSGGSATGGSATGGSATGGSSSGGDATNGGTELANTGPGSATDLAWIGWSVLLLGAVLTATGRALQPTRH
jgi:hypothetical protein